ncbi:MAG: right-handed parallel beta-helix repeat-containing protein, partial [Thermoplasmata archaeon]|nr:right-handed parallel beta-helix repeat-containing protein [Thermoplasmata archaeon]
MSQIVLAFGLALPVMLSFPVTAPGDESAFTPHEPIFIWGNDDFTSANGVTQGSGAPSDPYIIEGWEINASENRGIHMSHTDAHFVVRDVYVHSGFLADFPYNEGITLYNASNGALERVKLTNNVDDIEILRSSNISVCDSNFWGNTTVGQVELADHGVFAAWSDNITISGNRYRAYYQGAIWVTGYSTNITITDNIIWDSLIGMDLVQGISDVVVRNNTLVNNNWGIIVALGPHDLLLYHNIFSNTQQVMDVMGPENSWDNGYPSGGNYWSDYLGVDNCSGPNQDICPDPDGIGDTPYVIDIDSQDRYPLISPSMFPPPLSPRILDATLTGGNMENISIAWSISFDDGNGLGS